MRFLRLKDVMSLTGLGRSTIYKFMADETDFPKSVPLGGRAVAWVESEIEEWMESRLSMRDKVTQTSNHIINRVLAKQSHAPFLQLERDKK